METDNYSEESERETSRKLTPEKVVSILRKHGTKVSVEEAFIILQFMRKVADIAVNQYLSVRKG
jgi:3-methyladenine DNA glycosylase AlkC